MTATQKIAAEKINKIEIGSKIRFLNSYNSDKIFEVKKILVTKNSKINQIKVFLLEDGLPETRIVEGKYLAEGKTFKISNLISREINIYKSYMNWEFVK